MKIRSIKIHLQKTFINNQKKALTSNLIKIIKITLLKLILLYRLNQYLYIGFIKVFLR